MKLAAQPVRMDSSYEAHALEEFAARAERCCWNVAMYGGAIELVHPSSKQTCARVAVVARTKFRLVFVAEAYRAGVDLLIEHTQMALLRGSRRDDG
jgi:hypothetical protein